MKVRKLKKAMKKSSGFLSILMKECDGFICLDEDDIIVYNKKGITLETHFHVQYCYIPYTLIAKIKTEN